MRRTAAALATAVLAAVVLTGPLAATGQAGPADTIRCGGGATAPACPLLDQLAAQLGPLQPVLGLAGPAVAGLVPELLGSAAQADQASGVPAAQVASQVDALLDQLAVLPAPVRGLLSTAQLDGLIATLEDLLGAVTAPATGGQQAADGSQATPAATGGAAKPSAPARSTSTGAPTLGGSLSAPASSSGSSSPAIPDVPVGDSLTLAPLALPDFGFSPTIGAGPATEMASSATADAATEDVQLAAEELAAALPDGSSGTQVGVVVVLSLLLIGAAFAAQAHQNRHTIPD